MPPFGRVIKLLRSCHRTPLNRRGAHGLQLRAGDGEVSSSRISRFEALYILCLMCGLWQGEALALHWRDIDLDEGTLRVNLQLQRVRGGGGLRFSEPKNASRRTDRGHR